MSKTPERDQFIGCLTGQCLGDALGFPAEGWDRESCRRYVEDRLGAEPSSFPARPPYSPGQYTDDSQLARELMQSFAEKGRFSPRDYAARIAAIFRENRIVGQGRATGQAAKRLIEGVPWEEAGTPPPSAGNGSAMRAAPIGLLFHGEPDRIIENAIDQGRITHTDPRCGAGAVAIAGAASLALEAGPLDPFAFLEQLAEWVEEADEAFALLIRQLEEWIEMDPDEAQPLIARAGLGREAPKPEFGISPFVVCGVLWSLYAFLRHPNDYWSAIRIAISGGSDVDTTAAMTGAIAGARLGADAIPATLVRLVNDRGTWGHEDLCALASRCHDMKFG